jgi:hypothetical protein
MTITNEAMGMNPCDASPSVVVRQVPAPMEPPTVQDLGETALERRQLAGLEGATGFGRNPRQWHRLYEPVRAHADAHQHAEPMPRWPVFNVIDVIVNPFAASPA